MVNWANKQISYHGNIAHCRIGLAFYTHSVAGPRILPALR